MRMGLDRPAQLFWDEAVTYAHRGLPGLCLHWNFTKDGVYLNVNTGHYSRRFLVVA